MTLDKTTDSHTYRFNAFDTNVALSFWGDAEDALSCAKHIEQMCAEYESLFSRTIATSDVGRINSMSGEWVKVHPYTLDLVKAAVHYCSESRGAFDITVGPLISQWDFKKGCVPDKEDLQHALALVDWGSIELDEDACAVRLRMPGMMIDLGGIAKGWIADEIVADTMGEECGISGMIANLGGNVAVAGSKADSEHFVIGVKDPLDPAKNLATIPLESGSAVTSGIYERSFLVDGKRYHHVLNPKTGYPVDTDLLSATLVCGRSLDAEGFSTTVLALGKERGATFIRERPEIEHACLVCDNGELLLL